MTSLHRLYQHVLYACSCHAEPTDRVTVYAKNSAVYVIVEFIKNDKLYSRREIYDIYDTYKSNLDTVYYTLGLLFDAAHEYYRGRE